MTRRKSRQPKVVEFADLKGLRIRAYMRESTARQAEADRFGPDTQQAGILAFSAEFDLDQPERWYFDKVTGRHVAGRAEIQRALEEAEEYDVLLFFHTTRSFRNREDAAIWKQKFRAAGVILVFTQQRIISGDPKTKSIEFIHEFIDEQRSDEQEMFVRANLRQKWARGLVNGSTPLGLQRTYGAPGDPLRGRLVVEPRGRATVRAIWDLWLTGKHSHAGIATRLNAERDADGQPLHRSKRGGPLTPSGVRQILSTQSYTGVTVWHPGTPEEEVGASTHEAIVTPEEFDRGQQISRERAFKPGRAPTKGRVYPFSGPAHCLYCGRTYVGDAGGKSGYLRMRHAFGECQGPITIALSRLDRQMGELLATRFVLPSEWRDDVLRLVATPAPTADPSLLGRRDEIQRAMRKHAQIYQWTNMSETDFHAEQRQLERALLDIDRALQVHQPACGFDPVHAGDLLENFGELWSHPGVSLQSKKEFIEEAFDEILFDELGIRALTPTEPFRPLVAVAEVGGFGAGDRIRTGDPLLGKHYPTCAVLDRGFPCEYWGSGIRFLSSYLLLHSLVSYRVLRRRPRGAYQVHRVTIDSRRSRATSSRWALRATRCTTTH